MSRQTSRATPPSSPTGCLRRGATSHCTSGRIGQSQRQQAGNGSHRPCSDSRHRGFNGRHAFQRGQCRQVKKHGHTNDERIETPTGRPGRPHPSAPCGGGRHLGDAGRQLRLDAAGDVTKTAGTVNQFVYWGRPLDWRNQTLTPNPDTLYFMAFYNTQDVGPIVIEIPPG